MEEMDITSFCSDVAAASVSFALCSLLVSFYRRTCAKGLIGVYLLGKLIHISQGLVVMLLWPMFSPTLSGRILAGLIPGLSIFGPFATRKRRVAACARFVDKYRDSRHLLTSILCYGLTVGFATVFYWRKPIAIAAICNLCAGDGIADIAGRRFGRWKLPYNKNKSFVGSISMAIAGFMASIIYMYYFYWLGWINIEGTPNMVIGFLVASVTSAVVESHPLSSTLEDNLTVPVASILVGTFLL